MNKNVKYDVVVVGAGASGLVAGYEAAKGGARVLILERMDAPGKKILATGNGKCNLTNEKMDGGCFRGSGKDLASYGIEKMTPDRLRRYFYQLGLFTIDKEGYVYPVTEQAKTVLSVLLFAVRQAGADIHTGEAVTSIEALSKKGYRVITNQGRYEVPFVVLSAGGKASPKLGSDGSGMKLALGLGLSVKKPLPALTALTTEKKEMKQVSGVRTNGELTLYVEGKEKYRERGQMQLASYGISGIPVFQLSRFAIEALEEKKRTEVHFDFFPDLSFGDLRGILRDFRKEKEKTAGEILCGLVQEKWIPLLLIEAQIPKKEQASRIGEKSWNRLVSLLKAFPVPINGYRDFDFAQVTQGGVRGDELTKEMESRKRKGLYLTGELVDVDGICGGYNLHWAFTSGYLAGTSIRRKIDKQKETKGGNRP